jgi:hypothetical protein
MIRKRLDRVITNALEFVEKHQDENEERAPPCLRTTFRLAVNIPFPEKTTHVEMPP